jgi:hypothetical protein
VEEVQDDVAVIGDDPLAEREAVHAERAARVIFFQAVFDFVGDGLQLRLGGAGADDVKIGEERQAAQVDGDDVLRLFIGGNSGAQACE